ncbi:uncharacterized protein LOC111328549 [Stylophora pistillata]|uniref:SKI/DACH domain-containing protein 1 n=1 Tax=Stylophora pistillata TaxID=50429 RepID=A0A2B4SA49_STYPI|nr:uncharacterized protein LOC111328549 [Stylophora pistillata]PFX26761.1 SKI/DACH domain-containing protein 1 [Stylophora pistillata]
MMSEETAAGEVEEKKHSPKCGRLVFRGVELAYLNIDGEFLLPLAELLALILPSTPRTTLFTRMEKMKVRRHFCDPEEIKLLKTVNGIHGSSANCTLLSKTEVEKYCSIYIDKRNELNQTRRGDVTAEPFGSESDRRENGCKDKENSETTYQNNKAIPNKLAVLDKHKKLTPLRRNLKLTKFVRGKKLKLRSEADCQVNKTLTDNTTCAAIDGDLTSGNVNECGEGFLVVPPCSSHKEKNCTQTQALEKLAMSKKRSNERDSVDGNRTIRKGTTGKKRSANDLDKRGAFGSPLKIPKRSELNRHVETNKIVNGTAQFRFYRYSSKKQDVDSLISDSSSTDSGFASKSLSNASTPTKTDFSAVELTRLLRKDEKVKVTTPKKNKTSEEDYGKSLTLSPPALLLKRYEDSWLVEEKSPVSAKFAGTKLLPKDEAKPRKTKKKASLTPLFEEVCGPVKPLSDKKEVRIKKKSFRKPPSLKEEIGSREPLITNNLIVKERHDLKGFKKKPKRKDKLLKFKSLKGQTLLNGKVFRSNQNAEISAKNGKNPEIFHGEMASPVLKAGGHVQTQEELMKKDKVLERVVGDALAKYFAPTLSEPAPLPGKVDKPKAKKTKILGVAKPILKTNSYFKLSNLFPLTSPLTLQDGALSPLFTMSCPKGSKPDSNHALWKWNLGGPVVRDSPDLLKPKILNKKPISTLKLSVEKVRKLKRKRTKPLASKKPPSLWRASVCNDITSVSFPADSAKESVPNATETEILYWQVKSDAVSCSAGVKVS